MTTLKCSKCDFEVTKPTLGRCKLSIRLHWRKVHTGAPPENAFVPVKTKQPREPKAVQIAVNFCPCCGTDLHKVAMGMALAGRAS